VAVIVDSSVWIDYLNGVRLAVIEKATAELTLVLSPLVIAELLSGDLTVPQRAVVGELLQDFALHTTPLAHWIDVANLRRLLRSRGLNVTIPDAHVAQCALDLDAILYTRDDIFLRIAAHTPLRLDQLR
jgi:predicted nucleic acid-binding protein